MGVSAVYDAVFNASTLRQVTNSSFQENVDILNGRYSGSPVIADQFVQNAAGVAELTTAAVGNFLSIFGALGGVITDGSTVVIPFHKKTSGGSFNSGSVHTRVRGTADGWCRLIPMNVSAPAQGACTANGAVHFLSNDGETKPWVVQNNQALASQAFSAEYGLGPLFVNGVAIDRQIGFQVNFGVGVSEKKHYNGAPYPSDIFDEEYAPSIEFSQEDFSYLTTVTGGLAFTSVMGVIRRRASGSTYYGADQAQHLTFSFANGMATMQQIGASDTKNGQQGVRLAGRALTLGIGVAYD